MAELTVGSLFSGCGGLDLGLERAGMAVRWQAEVDLYASAVLTRHWPDTPNLGDVTKIDWSTVERVDVVAGGFPCQPFSSAGLRRGIDDERWLWPEFVRCLRVIRPRHVIVENVPDLVSDPAFGIVLGDLHELGFDAEWSIVSACSLGAPHTRRRLFVLAHPQNDNGEHPVQLPAGASSGRPEPRGTCGDARRHGWVPKSDVRRMVDGVPTQLDGVMNDAYATEAGPTEELFGLRSSALAEDGQRSPRGSRSVPSAQVLRQGVHGGSDGDRQPVDFLSEAVQAIVVRVMRDHRTTPCASPRRGQVEQLAGELADALLDLPCPLALGPREDVAEEVIGYLHDLWSACVQAGALLYPSDSVQAAWESLSGEAQAWALVGAVRGPWHDEWPGVGHVAVGVPKRMVAPALRATGNAVVPAVAEHVGRLILEAAR